MTDIISIPHPNFKFRTTVMAHKASFLGLGRSCLIDTDIRTVIEKIGIDGLPKLLVIDTAALHGICRIMHEQNPHQDIKDLPMLVIGDPRHTHIQELRARHNIIAEIDGRLQRRFNKLLHNELTVGDGVKNLLW